MNNLYDSLYNYGDVFSTDLGINIIEKISGQRDLITLSKYFNFEEYISATDVLDGNYFNVIHINIRSLRKNFDFLQSFLKCLPKPPAIIAITETWLQEHTNQLYPLEGYDSFHLVRTEREHGGISVYSNKSLN